MRASVGNNSTTLEAYELALDDACMRAVETDAAAQVHALFQKHRAAIARLGPERRAHYNQLHAVARHEEPGMLDLPETIAVPLPTDSANAPDHLCVDRDGAFNTKLNGWEKSVLAAERIKPDFLAWRRNVDRKSWALAFPYSRGGNRLPGFPDFIVLRGTVDEPAFDILEPHRGEDSVAKAKRLAEFADRHGSAFGRIELIRVAGEQITRLDLNDHRVRTAVLPIVNPDELDRLFDQQN